jgi:hypothetical protein
MLSGCYMEEYSVRATGKSTFCQNFQGNPNGYNTFAHPAEQLVPTLTVRAPSCASFYFILFQSTVAILYYTYKYILLHLLLYATFHCTLHTISNGIYLL